MTEPRRHGRPRLFHSNSILPREKHIALGRVFKTKLTTQRDTHPRSASRYLGDAIECRLRAVSLDDQPSFKAISYVWGDAQHKRGITVDGQSFFVTQNLFRGLQRIRDPATKLTIWVDALCINQTDSDERREQVQLMRAIYTSANEVLI
jgi:hypothetical protein